MAWLDKIPLFPLLVGAVVLGLAPFWPEPHLWEKLSMLMNGSLTQPLDIFDLVLHGAFPILLALKLVRQFQRKKAEAPR